MQTVEQSDQQLRAVLSPQSELNGIKRVLVPCCKIRQYSVYRTVLDLDCKERNRDEDNVQSSGTYDTRKEIIGRTITCSDGTEHATSCYHHWSVL